MALSLQASAVGFALADSVDAESRDIYNGWIAAGRHGTMDYCARYRDVRDNPALLLEGARTVISCAFCYNSGIEPEAGSPTIARYALGYDYHYVLKDRLARLGDWITARYGGQTRAVVDTAPMRERYWAVRAGIGFIGLNNQLIVPGAGSYFFLGELLWTGDVPPDEPCTLSCDGCGRCVRSCPGAALDGMGGCDARRCLSYLTIEHKPVPNETPDGIPRHGYVYGCDICQRVCPHNASAPRTTIAEFTPDPQKINLKPDDIRAMTSSGYKRFTAHSAMRRIPLKKLIYNMSCIEYGSSTSGGDNLG